MEKFEVDEQLYKSQKNKKKNGYKQNYFYFILSIIILLISISFFIFFMNNFKNLKNEIKLLKEDNQILKQKYLKYKKPDKNNNVLLISNVFTDDDKTSPPLLYELLKNLSFISNIKIIHPSTILDKMTEVNLINYNIVIFDLKQSGYANTKTKIEYIKHYIAHGGNILVTHDHWTALAGPVELFGGYRCFLNKGSIVNKAEIVYNNHKIFNSFYDLTEEKNINISPTHSGWMKVNDTLKQRDTVLIKLKDEIESEYLMQREIGLGKCVYWNVGHSYNFTNFESKLFTNILAWFCE